MIDWTKHPHHCKRKTSRKKKIFVNPSYNIREVYRFYRFSCKTKKKPYVDIKTFKLIQYEYNKVLSEEIRKGKHIRMPWGVGEVGIIKRKMKYNKDGTGMNIDWGVYNKTGIKTYHLNMHSEGWRTRFYWDKQTCRIDNHNFYSFAPCLNNKRAVAKTIFNANSGIYRYYDGRIY